jgi:hypothetical protein
MLMLEGNGNKIARNKLISEIVLEILFHLDQEEQKANDAWIYTVQYCNVN